MISGNIVTRSLWQCALTFFISATLLAADDLTQRVSSPISELSRKVVRFQTRKVTYVRIEAPQLLPVPPEEHVAPVITDEQIAIAERRAGKQFECISPSVVVHIGQGGAAFTELTWWQGDRRFSAISNVDFRHLANISDLETLTHVYSWFPFISELPSDQGQSFSASLQSIANGADYLFEGTQADTDANGPILDALDAFHAFYDLNRASLIEAYNKRVADAALAERRLLENPPPPPPDATLYFWRKSSTVQP